MATESVRATRPTAAEGWTSVWIVMGVTVIALLLGWLVRTAVDSQTRLVAEAGVTAAVPAGWISQGGFDELRLVTWNSQLPEERYSVGVLSDAGAPIDAAAQRNAQRAQLLGTYRLLGEDAVVVDGEDAYRVRFAYVPAETPRLPIVIQGVDYYLARAGGVVVVSMEAPQDRFEAALPRFLRFLVSVEAEDS